MYPFGQDFNYIFEPIIDDEALISIPAEAATLYIFRDRPTRPQSQSGSGAVATASTTWGSGESKITFTVPAIIDPNPTDESADWIYYASVNFLLKTSGQTQTVTRPITLQRVRGQNKPLNVTFTDLTSVYPHIGLYSDSSKFKLHLNTAIEIVKSNLRSQQFEWSLIYRHDSLKLVVILKTLSIIMLGESQLGNDEFRELSDRYEFQAKSLFESLKIEYQSSQDAVPTKTDTGSGFAIITI